MASVAELLDTPSLASTVRSELKARGIKGRRAIEDSAVVEREMKPALEGDLKQLWCECSC